MAMVESLLDGTAFQGAGRYLYSGLIQGFLVTGGFFFFAAFLLMWPATFAFTAIFAVTTAITTVLGAYLLFRDDTRQDHSQALNDYTTKIRTLFDEIKYYETKLAQENALLKTPQTSFNPHKTIAAEDLEHIQKKIDQLKALYDELQENNLPKVREEASSFINGLLQRHWIGSYKALVSAYVFYGSFPLFIALAINAIVAPVWLAPLAIPILVVAGAAAAFGIFKSFLDESLEVAKFDAAIKESIWIENSAKTLVADCERHMTDENTLAQRRALDKRQSSLISRKDMTKDKKNANHFLIKHAQDEANSAATLPANLNNELRKRIPLLDKLAKPLGDRLPVVPFEVDSPDTYGHRMGWSLHSIADFFYQFTLVNTVVDFIGKFIFAGIFGGIIPGGVALYIKFILGVTFTPLMVNAFIIAIVSTTVLTLCFSQIKNYWNKQEATLKTLSDHVNSLSLEVTEDLKTLQVERATLYSRVEAERDHLPKPLFQTISHEGREILVERKNRLAQAIKALREQGQKMSEDNFLMSFVKWASIIFDSITTGYAWYMGFPLFVVLTLTFFFPITSPLVIYGVFAASALTGFFGFIYTFDTAAQASEQSELMVNQALVQSDAADELLKHFDKPLRNKDLSSGKEKVYRMKNEELEKHFMEPGDSNLPVHKEYTTGQFELLKALRKPEVCKNVDLPLDDPIYLSDPQVRFTLAR
jgi:hypothetical protein